MNNTFLYYSECGAGFPLVLLHGNGESSEYFARQTEFFSKCYRVIAVDTRGHGHSPRGTAPFTLEQFADDLKEFLDSMKIDRCNLLGFSDGANIAMIFTLKYPKYVEKLILNGANLYPSGVKASDQIPICIGYAAVSLISFFDKKAVLKKEMLGLMVTQPHIKPDELKKIAAPSLVIVGTEDMILDRHSELIAKSLPNARFVRIEGDHFIAAKNSEAFNAAAGAFLKEDSLEIQA